MKVQLISFQMPKKSGEMGKNWRNGAHSEKVSVISKSNMAKIVESLYYKDVKLVLGEKIYTKT